MALSDRAEILQARSCMFLVVSAKFLGQGVIWFNFGGVWSEPKWSFGTYRGHSFCSKRTCKDSGVGLGFGFRVWVWVWVLGLGFTGAKACDSRVFPFI